MRRAGAGSWVYGKQMCARLMPANVCCVRVSESVIIWSGVAKVSVQV